MSEECRFLYTVAVPIGNIEDFTLRACRVLEESELIFCEDTRKSQDLFQRAGLKISAPLKSLPAFKEREIDWDHFFESVESVQKISFVSDAGTPLLNDPGKLLLKEAKKRAWTVVTVPGVSALSTAIQMGGAFHPPYLFAGYVPKKKKEVFFEPLNHSGSFIFFDTKHEILDTLDFLCTHEEYSKRSVCLLREMTKEFEEVWEGSLVDLKERMLDRVHQQKVGELTLVLEGSLKSAQLKQSPSIEELLSFRHSSKKEASKWLSKITAHPVKDCYQRLIESAKENS